MSSPHPERSTDQQNADIKDKSPIIKTSKSAPVADVGHGRNEGVNPHWSYEPPTGAVLCDGAVESGDFEWDTIKKNDDLEIWIIRVPDYIKAKHLVGLQVDRPVSSRSTRVGSLTRKHVVHDVWSIGEDEADEVGGDELRGLSCLFPRKKKGKLYIAPKAAAHHIIVSAQATAPTAPEHQPIIHQNPARPAYPQDALQHHFIPYGARLRTSTANTGGVDDSLCDAQAGSIVASCSGEKGGTEQSEPKRKKRKVEGGSPKKPKKHKSKQ